MYIFIYTYIRVPMYAYTHVRARIYVIIISKLFVRYISDGIYIHINIYVYNERVRACRYECARRGSL